MNKIILKKLILDNFQIHRHLELDFVNGLNVIVGSSGTGKSAIIRSIRFLLFNDISVDDCRREGSKQTSVKGIFSDSITLERIKSNSINRYILNVPNEKEKVFDSIGKEIPNEIKDIFGYNELVIDKTKINLNIANQISLPFLLDESGAFRNRLFNLLTGGDVIDSAMSSLNKDILELNREEKSNKEFIDNNEPKLKDYQTKIEEKKKLLGNLSHKIEQLSYNIEHYNSIKENQNNLIQIDSEIANLMKQEIKIPDVNLKELDNKIEKLRQLNKIYSQLKTQKQEFNELKDKLDKIKIPELDRQRLENSIEKITKYTRIIKELKDIGTNSDSLIIRSDNVIKKLEESKKAYLDLLKQAGICPVCKNEITKEHISHLEI